jgi:ribosomal protein L31E
MSNVDYPGIYHFRVTSEMLLWLRANKSAARLRRVVESWMAGAEVVRVPASVLHTIGSSTHESRLRRIRVLRTKKNPGKKRVRST